MDFTITDLKNELSGLKYDNQTLRDEALLWEAHYNQCRTLLAYILEKSEACIVPEWKDILRPKIEKITGGIHAKHFVQESRDATRA